ncbi:MAG: acyl-CoA dehydrogenase family protein [bacterium]|nr:acyl-CoA dehydrogenase family protein [bacterium]
MDFSWSAEEEAFRQEIRGFLQAELPEGWGVTQFWDPDDDSQFAFAHDFTKKLGARNWLAVSWPKEYGGLQWPFWQQFIFNEEMANFAAPIVGNNARQFLGPTLFHYGTDEQIQQHIPSILNGETVWAQGYSEPNAGSDLASLQTRAVQDGDEFIINGQKIWTSMAHHSDWIFMLARTDPEAPKHRGISYFLLDLKTPGVTIKPLIDMTDGHHFNEVYFDNVRLPRSGLLGELNRGWYQATTTLSFERSGIGRPAVASRYVQLLTRFAKETKRQGRPLAEDPVIRQRLAQLATETEVCRSLAWRIASIQTKGDVPGPEAPALKVFASELMQRVAHTGMQLLQLYGQLRPGSKWAPLAGAVNRLYLTSVSSTIAAGTSEIQRNIIAERGLGLPR